MEIECVVCGSQNDLRTLRCFVCGAELPPALDVSDHYDPTFNVSSLQGMQANVKTPLSVGALPLEEVLSKRPYDIPLDEQQISSSNISILLEPEDLSPVTADLVRRQEYEKFTTRALNDDGSISESMDDISLIEDIPDIEADQRLEEQAKQQADSTWIGIPIPELKKDSKYEVFEKARRTQSLDYEAHSSDDDVSPYTPISKLLASHQRKNISEENTKQEIFIPRENSLTGDELKNIEAEVLPNPWTPIAEKVEQEQELEVSTSSTDSTSSADSTSLLEDSGEPLVVDPPRIQGAIDEQQNEEDEEHETALRVSIPELLAVTEPKAEVKTPVHFAPITSLAYPDENLAIPSTSTDSQAQIGEESALSAVDLKENSASLDNVQLDQDVAQAVSSTVTKNESLDIKSEDLPTQKFDSERAYAFSGLDSDFDNEKEGLSLFSWMLLVLASLSVGVVIALYLMPNTDLGVETRLQVTQITRGEQSYRVNLKAFAQPQADLIIPDSYLTLGQSPLTRVKGSATVSIEVPEDQVQVGQNLLTFQWAYASGGEQAQRFSPVDVSIPVYYKQGEVRFSPSKQAFLLEIELGHGLSLVESEKEFELAEEKHHYHFVIPKAQAQQKTSISFSAEIQDTDQTKQELRLSYLLPQNTEPFVILSPVNRYARPDSTVHIRGKVTALAKVSIHSVSKNGIAITAPPTIVTASNNGEFTLPFNFGQRTRNKAGDIWKLDLRAVDHRGLSQSQSIELKQSHAPTWQYYVKRLKDRRDRAVPRYRHFIYRRLHEKIDKYKGKAGTISGEISFIDRGNDQQVQRFLMQTCAQQKCPIWVEDENAFWVNIGQTVSIFAVVSGEESYPLASGEKLTAPLLRSRLTTP